MKRFIILLALISLLAPSAWAWPNRVLVISNNTSAGTGNFTTYVRNVWGRQVEVNGIRYDQTLASDSTTTWALLNSGRYDCAVLINLPALSSSYDSDAELNAIKWYHLGDWIDRNSAYASPIPMIVPVPTSMPTTGVWAAAYTGQLAATTNSGDSYAYVPMMNAAGDSIYTRIFYTGRPESEVATTDSASWCRPLVWRYTAGMAAVHQRYSYLWMTSGTGNHRVVYMPYAYDNWKAFLWSAALAMFTETTPVEVPFMVEFAGYINTLLGDFTSDGVPDTVGMGINLKALKDRAVASGLKVDFLTTTYSAWNQATTKWKYTVPAWAAAYPNNIRMTHNSYTSWNTTGNYDWFGAVNAASYSQMLKRGGYSQDSTAAHWPSITSKTRVFGYDAAYAGVGSAYAKHDSIMLALDALNIADLYVKGNCNSGRLPPSTKQYSLVGPRRTWLGAGFLSTLGTRQELRMHAYQREYKYEISAYSDSIRLAYMTRWADERAGLCDQWPADLYGYYFDPNGTVAGISAAATTTQVANLAQHQAGFKFTSPALMGGSRTDGFTQAGVDSSKCLMLLLAEDVINHVEMANAIAQYGTSPHTAMKYAWIDEVKWDRRCKQQFANSHIRRL